MPIADIDAILHGPNYLQLFNDTSGMKVDMLDVNFSTIFSNQCRRTLRLDINAKRDVMNIKIMLNKKKI